MIYSSDAAFALGLFTAFGTSAIIRTLIGMKLSLYFVNPESSHPDQALIPVTAGLKKRSLWRTLTLRQWNEDIEITLSEKAGVSATFQIGYHVWNRYYLSLNQGSLQAKLNGELIQSNQKYYLRTGMDLEIGEKVFKILVSPAPPEHLQLNDSESSDNYERNS